MKHIFLLALISVQSFAGEFSQWHDRGSFSPTIRTLNYSYGIWYFSSHQAMCEGAIQQAGLDSRATAFKINIDLASCYQEAGVRWKCGAGSCSVKVVE